MTLLDRILLSYYSAAVAGARRQRERYEPATYYLFQTSFFFVLCAIGAILVSIIPYHFSGFALLGIMTLLWIISFFSTTKWLKYHVAVKKGNTISLYKTIKGKTFWYTFTGWMLFVGSFALMFIVFVNTIESYGLK